MNEHTQPDWHDALIDRGLAEIVGGETPPDLSERILAAAAAHSPEPVTLAQGTIAMTTPRQSNWAGMKPWLALCATVAIVGTTIGLLMPEVRVAQEQSGPQELARAEQKTIGLSGQSNDGLKRKPKGVELDRMVTPHVIVEKESDDFGKPADALGEIQIAERNFDSDGTLRSLAPPVIYPWPEDLQHSSSHRHKFAEVDLSGRSSVAKEQSKTFSQGEAGQRFRIDASPGSNLDRFGLANSEEEGDGYFDSRGGEQVERWGMLLSRRSEQGTGPGTSGDQYTRIHENPFIVAQGENAVSTFSIDVDTASYANVRQFLQQSHRLPPPDAVRIEELVNYFDYDYAGPTDDKPFAAHLEVAGCPWNSEHRLVRIALKGREIDRQARPQSNLVFLIDVSGSMDEPNKLPLLIESMKQFTRELGENDKVAIVVYASSEGLALGSTRGDQQQTILSALDQLRAGGSTAGGAGIQLAYQTAIANFISGGVNRVILCTDGDFNVGVTSTADLERLAEEKAKQTGVFLTVLGFGRGNLNDAMMEAISGKGNGNYHYVDNLTEGRKVLVEEMTGTLITIAKDVKIQVEFNPAQVGGYRLIGYENRMLRTEDFNDDKKDAGEIGAGHTVTALYEIVPTAKPQAARETDPLKYQAAAKPRATSDELLTLKLRYKLPDGDTSTRIEFPLVDPGKEFVDASEDFQFASAVASFGMLLRNSEHKGHATFDTVLETAQAASHQDEHGYRAEFLELVRLAKQLSGDQQQLSGDQPSTSEGP